MVYVNPAGFPTPDLPNIGWKVWISLVVMVITSGLFVTIRVWTRIAAKNFGADDLAIVAAQGSFIIQTILWCLSVRFGYGSDILKLSDEQVGIFLECWFLGTIFYQGTITMYKVSVLLLLNRIFVQRPFKIACWIVLAVCVGWSLGNLFGWIFQCWPIPVMWGVDEPYKCINQNAMLISVAVWDVTIDTAALILPQPMVWKLNLKNREKVMLAGMFLLGAVVVVFSLMSCSAVITHLEAAATDKNTYSFALANLFQVLESGVGIIGACLPLMRQPLKQVWPRLFGSSRKREQYYYDDQFSDQYVLQNVSNGQRGAAWNTVSVSGPELFKSAQRKSDELGIIDETLEADGASGKSESGVPSAKGRTIRKEIAYSIDRR